ncbi:COX15/CtaA family protein [Catenovulum sp. SM1970]|nr:COX15/CtaA family protein [Marinifaba aquimaris]NTS76521.1 COX15/CtaA family protein [Marinifaba aquimaris]
MRFLVYLSLFLACFVIVLGAYTRLTDAGLGCPDWPGCYGFFSVPQGSDIAIAEQAYPERPLEPDKAWNEMIHRYLASSLGFSILLLTYFTFKLKQQRFYFHSSLLLILVCFQGALGMWTVTMNLMPIIVMGHLLGGFTIFSLLCLMAFRLGHYQIRIHLYRQNRIFVLSCLCLVFVFLQIALGGWTSANYAALVCTELPICEDGWLELYQYQQAFSPISPVADNYEFGVLDFAARVTIHSSHRIGAMVVTAIVLIFLAYLFHAANCKVSHRVAWLISLLLITQIALGVSNIVFLLPLSVAVAHNFVALLLLVSFVFVIYSIKYRTGEHGYG